MAQWSRQYTGNTHATRVADLEASLRRAVSAFTEAQSDPERASKAKSVRKLAERLLLARRRLLAARRTAAQQVRSGEALAEREKEISRLQERAATLDEGGLRGILAEFHALDAMPE